MTANIRFSSSESSAISTNRTESHASLAWSLGLHAGMAALLVLSAWALREEAGRDDTFVVYGAPSSAAVANADARADDERGGDGAASATGPNFVTDMRRRQRFEENRAQREIERMRAQRRIEDEREATQAAARAEPEKVRTSDTPTNNNRAITESRNRATSYEAFRRDHPGVGRTTSTAQITESGPGARIDTNQIFRSGDDAGNGRSGSSRGPASSATNAGERSMDAYFRDLTARLKASHEKPGGLNDLLSAEVEFMVAASGVISDVRIARSSGNREFDRSVLDAFGRVRMPARPDGKSDAQRLTFRMREG